jgi:phosphate transport system permease protein
VTTIASTQSGARPAPSPSIGKPARSRALTDAVATVLVWAALALAVIPLVWILWAVVSKGAGDVLNVDWWTNSQRGITAREVGGGAYHAIMGTILEALVCAVISVPIAIFTAIYLVEYGRGRLARVVSFMVDILTGVPSIVAALFIYAVWVSTLGLKRVGFAVSLALVLLMIPVVVRSTEEMLRLVPDELREASYALGVPKWKTIVRIVFPIAMPGIISGVLLSVARVIGETAPVLILVGYSRSINLDIFHGNMASLPLLIYTELTNPEHAGFLRIWGAALTLIILVATINLLAAAFRFLATLRR